MPIQRYDLGEFLQTTFQSSEPVVEGLINLEQNSLLVATQKAGKTMLSCQLALCVSHGVDFLRWRVPQARKVLYFAFEGSDAAIQRRLRRQSAGLGITEIKADNLVLFRTPYLFIAHEPVLKALDLLVAQEKPDLIVFDPLYRLLAGGSITSDEVVMGMTGALMALSMTHHHATWLPTHEHRTKRDTWGEQYEPDLERYAGSYVLAAWCDAMFGLTFDKKTKKAEFLSHFEREEEGEPRDALSLKLLDTPDKLVFELGIAERILLKLPQLAGLGLRAAARDMGLNFESFRSAAQELADQGRLALYPQGPGKETILGLHGGIG